MQIFATTRENNSQEGRSVEFGEIPLFSKVSQLEVIQIEFRKSVSTKLLVSLLACNSKPFHKPDIFGKKAEFSEIEWVQY